MSARLPSNVIREARRREPVAFWLGTWFGCGLSPLSPGTVGALGAMPIYLAVHAHGPIAIGAAALAITVVGIWASQRVAQATSTTDPQIVVIDEAAGVMLALAFAPHTWAGVVTAFVAFRMFDMYKPPPCRWAERAFRPGISIMLDDVFAGLWAGALVLLARWLGWL